MRRLVFRKQADREFADAVEWYKSRDVKVAVAFIETIERLLQGIQENPFQYQAIEENIRQATLRRFPYKVVYQVTKTELVIISCFHTARDPDVLRGRLP